MKFHLRALFVLEMLVVDLIAQNQHCGLYLTAQDFSNGKLSYQSRNTQIRPHELFRKNTIKVKYNHSVFVYEKKNIFGYADKDGSYRFVDNRSFSIVNPGEQILLYKITSGTGLKNSPIVETFYFSKDADSAVQLLTIHNLLSAFANNPSFTKLIEICFTRDSELQEYDTIHHKYRINRLLEIAGD
jgi:hypothetical protein